MFDEIQENTMIILEQTIHENLSPNENLTNIISNKTSSSTENLNLLSQLTKITSDDYMGKEKCTMCLKTVGENHQAISCNSCDRWTHRKCTATITKNKYKKLSKINFNWFCNNCRETEIPLPKLSEPLKLDPKNLPVPFSIVKKGKNELLIIHLN